jgi:hypothetical protein
VFFGTHMSRRKTDQILFHRCGGETLRGLQPLRRRNFVKRNTPCGMNCCRGIFLSENDKVSVFFH